jgi:beta-N-acetylhexosaminidase
MTSIEVVVGEGATYAYSHRHELAKKLVPVAKFALNLEKSPQTGTKKPTYNVVSSESCGACKGLIGILARDYKDYADIRIIEVGADYNMEEYPNLATLVDTGLIGRQGVPQVFMTDSKGETIKVQPAIALTREFKTKFQPSEKPLAPLTQQLSSEEREEYSARFAAVTLLQMDKNFRRAELKYLKDNQPAGVVFYSNKIEPGADISSVRQRIDSVTRVLGDGAIIAVDQEGGNVQRMKADGICRLPKAEVLEGLPDRDVREFARILARDLARVGVTMNLGPVLDLKNERNIDISGWGRAVSTDTQEVIRVTSIIVEELQKTGIYPVIKHFPGIGWTENTHERPSIQTESTNACTSCGEEPFRALTNLGQELGVMIGHIVIPEIDSKLPVALSKKFINDEVILGLGIREAIINDNFNMNGSSDLITEQEAAYRALLAGIAPLSIDSGRLSSTIEYFIKRLQDPKESARAYTALIKAEQRVKSIRNTIRTNEKKRNVPQGSCTKSEQAYLDSLKNKKKD